MFEKSRLYKILSNLLAMVLLITIIGTTFTNEINAETTEKIKTQWDFSYTGDTQKFVVPADGNYTFEAWGAEGGLPSDGIIMGGKGAYVKGVINLKKGDKLDINVGGQSKNTNKGGFNGGGDGGISSSKEGFYAGGGGGATDIRKSGTDLSNRIIVAGGGGGGGLILQFFNYQMGVEYSERRLLSGSGAGGKTIGQGSGTLGEYQRAEKAPYSEAEGSGGGGGQNHGGYGVESYRNYEARGTMGKGGSSINEDLLGSSSGGWKYSLFLNGGGGAGLYGGGSRITGFESHHYGPNGGGGSSSLGMLTPNTTSWSNGWEAQPSPRGGYQSGNSGHGYARITKANDPPIINLIEKATSDKVYHSETSVRYSGTLRDIDGLGGNIKLLSEFTINPDGSSPEVYKQEHGIFKNSIEEQYFSTDVYLPYYRYNSNTKSMIKFWAEDSQGLKSEILTTYMFITSPKDIQIMARPETEEWVRGSYKVNLEVKSANNIKSITTSVGKLNITNHISQKEQEGYILVTENKPITIRVTDVQNRLEEKIIYINNIQDLEVSDLSKSSFKYKINNWGDEHGLVEKDTKWEVKKDSSEEEYTGSLSREIDKLSPNEKVDIRYKLFNELGMELVRGWTNYQSIYTLAEHPLNATINTTTKENVRFKFTPSSENVNKPRYIFKVIEIPKVQGSNISVETSNIVEEGAEVLIRNLKPDTTYTLEVATINGNDVQSEYKRMKDTSGNELRFNTKGSLDVNINSLADWNNAVLTGGIEYNNKHPVEVYISIGNQKIKVSNDILQGKNQQSFNINIKKGIGIKDAKLISKPEDAIKTYEITTALPDDIYDVYMETVIDGISEVYHVGWFGLDHKGPESKTKALFKRITKTNGILTIDKDNIKDISTANHEITIDYGMGRMPLFHNKLISYSEPMTIRLYDKLGNESILAWEFDTNGGYIEGEDDVEVTPPEEIPPINADDSIVEIEVPKGGTHMQTSLNGVTWSAWEERKDKVRVSLPTGDGMKSVFVRTGVEMLKETPVYNVETGTIEMVKQKGGEVSPLNNTRIYTFIMDLTPPKLAIRTMDNSLIAINGNITILLDIIDNLDKSPSFVVELLQRDGNGVLEGKAPASRTFRGNTNGGTTGTVKLSNLPESKTNANKLQPYTLKVTAQDAHGNKTVQHINFYVKYKQ